MTPMARVFLVPISLTETVHNGDTNKARKGSIYELTNGLLIV
jgi:hypothetical protein